MAQSTCNPLSLSNFGNRWHRSARGGVLPASSGAARRGTLKGNIIHRILKILKTSRLSFTRCLVGHGCSPTGLALAEDPLREIRALDASPNNRFGSFQEPR